MLKTIGTVAALALGMTAANAADLPVKAPPMAPVAVSTWTGCYLGANLGYGWGRGRESVTAAGVTVTGSENINGILGGGQIGCNYQVSNIVWGVEGDFQGTDQHHTTTVAAGGVTLSERDSLPWFGTIRGRVGVTLAPSWLVYFTGGGGGLSLHRTATATGLVAGTLTNNTTHGFWTLGGGIENMFMPHWSWKLEYLYLNTGNFTNTNAVLGVPVVTTARFTDNILRAGINYHF
jgi:outer membrane immunogenic protein